MADELQIETLVSALEAIREVYVGSDGFIPETCSEGYQQRLLKQMYQLAVDALGKRGVTGV